MKNAEFIPALRFHWLTRFFDPLVRLTLQDKRLKNNLLRGADIKDGDVILDFGCGTGTLAILAKEYAPKAMVHGVDIDSGILKIAEHKIRDSGYEIVLKTFDGVTLPYKNETFDKVL